MDSRASAIPAVSPLHNAAVSSLHVAGDFAADRGPRA
jgi:hypothetical protein